nr:hypothetical protein Iba_chr15bCG5970 [Ipomoea batatas]
MKFESLWHFSSDEFSWFSNLRHRQTDVNVGQDILRQRRRGCQLPLLQSCQLPLPLVAVDVRAVKPKKKLLGGDTGEVGNLAIAEDFGHGDVVPNKVLELGSAEAGKVELRRRYRGKSR